MRIEYSRHGWYNEDDRGRVAYEVNLKDDLGIVETVGVLANNEDEAEKIAQQVAIGEVIEIRIA